MALMSTNNLIISYPIQKRLRRVKNGAGFEFLAMRQRACG